MKQYVSFFLEKNEYAFPILKVQEIIKIPVITKIPNSPSYIEGVSNLRGKIIPVVNLKAVLGKPETEKPQKVIVLSTGKFIFGILIDDVSGVVTIEDTQIEKNSNLDIIIENGHIDGIAKLENRLIILLNEKKIIPDIDISLLEEEIVEVRDAGDKIEVVKKVEGIIGQTTVKEYVDAREFYQKYGIDKNDTRYAIVEDIVAFMDAVSQNDFETAETIMQSLIQKGQADLFKEVGRVAKKLNESLKAFKESLDPRLRDIAVAHMPRAVDQLQMVIDKTEQAATRTIDIVEKYILKMDELSNHIREIQGPEDSIKYLKNFKNSLEDDLMEIITTQSFQDLTGQTIRKVIKLVGDLEIELVKLITKFGIKLDEKTATLTKEPEKVSQETIDSLLEEFGF